MKDREKGRRHQRIMRAILEHKTAVRVLVLITVAAPVLVAFHAPILTRAGSYLAPTTSQRTDVLVLSGENVLNREDLRIGVTLLSQGKAKRMVVVLLYPLLGGPDIVVEQEFTHFIAGECRHLALQEGKVSILQVPIPGHPITLSEAKLVTDTLHREGARSAILFCDGFHARRSIAAYRQEASRMGLDIVPYAFFTGYRVDSWWKTSKGIGDFIEQSSKYFYYLIRGYLPVASLWSL
jgi:hypothetical protein